MSEHLPECPSTSTDPLAEDCCCTRLHACEQRVLDAGYEIGYSAAMDDGWGEPGHIKAAVSAALDAAREAVEALPREDGGYCFVLHACDVEAVIDNLKGKT